MQLTLPHYAKDEKRILQNITCDEEGVYGWIVLPNNDLIQSQLC